MQEAQHTPDPWQATKNPTGGFIISAGDLILAWMPGKTEAQKSNAKLIAAAPELLERLQLTTDSLEIILQFTGNAIAGEKRKLIEQRIKDNYAAIAKAVASEEAA